MSSMTVNGISSQCVALKKIFLHTNPEQKLFIFCDSAIALWHIAYVLNGNISSEKVALY